jgi:acetyl esterase/lipase
MPIGYLISTGFVATVAVSAVSGRRPRRSSPFRLSYVYGVWLNWPLVSFLLLVGWTALALVQSGAGSPVFWIGLGLAVLASTCLVVLRRLARRTGPELERALTEGVGADWRAGAGVELAGRLDRRPSLARVLFAPIASRRHGVERIANLRYGPAGRKNRLDLYRDRSDGAGRPVLVYLHARFGSKRFGARHLLVRLACEGWVCLSADYRQRSGLSDSLSDVKRVIAWASEHAGDYGIDPTAIFLAGSSLGGHLAARAALTPGDSAFQPGFESADTSVAGVFSLYGYYGPVAVDAPPSARLDYATTNAPPCFVAHGDRDSLVVVDDARAFVEQLRATSSNAVVYAELPGAQHGFDLFRSRRFDSVVDAIEAFAAYVRSRPRTGRRRGG